MYFKEDKLNIEWTVISALSEVIRIAVKGDKRSTYEQILKLSKKFYPKLFNIECSLLLKEQESNLASEYRQKAKSKSIIEEENINAIDIVMEDINQLKKYINVAKKDNNKNKIDKLKNKLILLEKVQNELDEEAYTENDILLRDTYEVDRSLYRIDSGKKFRDFIISDSRVLRVRLLHPDKPEHITGADIIYEHHNLKNETIRLAAIQYKLWEKKQLRKDKRMMKQIEKLSNLFCNNHMCSCEHTSEFSFPACSAFLRPTDKIQKANQKLLSTGEHIPICKLDSLWEDGRTYKGKNTQKLTYKGIQKVSISSKTFEELFKEGKIGSQEFDAQEIEKFYKNNDIFNAKERVIIHAQEIERYY